MYLDAILVDEPLTGGLAPRLGKAHLRTLTVMGFPSITWPGILDDLNRLTISYRWSTRAIAVDMESATLATQGYRLRVPYGTLLCVSDKPLHGEIKLPGAATRFYQRAVGEHLRIGIETIELLRGELASLHSRKLRSFDEPPFR